MISDGHGREQTPAMTNKHAACDMEVPSAFLCPITYEMFRDPVVVIASGQTYERGAILRHFRSSEIEPCSAQRRPSLDT